MTAPTQWRSRTEHVTAMRMPTQPDVDATRHVVEWVFVETGLTPFGYGDDWAVWVTRRKLTGQPDGNSLQAVAGAEYAPHRVAAHLGDYVVVRDGQLCVMTATEFEQRYERDNRQEQQ